MGDNESELVMAVCCGCLTVNTLHLLPTSLCVWLRFTWLTRSQQESQTFALKHDLKVKLTSVISYIYPTVGFMFKEWKRSLNCDILKTLL